MNNTIRNPRNIQLAAQAVEPFDALYLVERGTLRPLSIKWDTFVYGSGEIAYASEQTDDEVHADDGYELANGIYSEDEKEWQRLAQEAIDDRFTLGNLIGDNRDAKGYVYAIELRETA